VSKIPFSRRRQTLSVCVRVEGVVVNMLYSLCATSGSLYLSSTASVKCFKCVRYSVRYDGNFSGDDFDYLIAE
jgi:hypothetical protein